MKRWLSLLFLCFCCHGDGQVGNGVVTHTIASPAVNNAVVFPQLLSSNRTVLLTNAEFRCTQGQRLFFRNEAGYHAFDGAVLDTNVLNQLGLSLDQLQAAQDRLDKTRARHAAEEKAQAQADAALEASFSSQTNAAEPAMAFAPDSQPAEVHSPERTAGGAGRFVSGISVTRHNGTNEVTRTGIQEQGPVLSLLEEIARARIRSHH